jgi:hypothetical protein
MVIKKIIINIAIVAAVVFFMDFAIGRTLRYFFFKETSGLHFRTTYSMETTEAEILVFGASRANHHYVPEVFEDSLKMSFYNTGRDGNGVFFQTAILNSILKRYTPKVIILDYAGDFQKGDDAYDRLSSLLPYYKTHKEIRDIIKLKSSYENIKLLSEIYPFNSEILTIAIGNLEINKKRNPDNKGYVALYKEWQEEVDSIETAITIEPDSNKLATFRNSLNVAKNSGATVYVIYSPIFRKYNQRQEIDLCNDVCSNEDVPFWDYSRDTLFLNNNHLFQDVSHLNHNGAIIFSKLVCERIKQDLKSNMPDNGL